MDGVEQKILIDRVSQLEKSVATLYYLRQFRRTHSDFEWAMEVECNQCNLIITEGYYYKNDNEHILCNHCYGFEQLDRISKNR